MYFVPLNQEESVELVIHALRAAAGQTDCSFCPAYKVCTRQCLSVADAIEQMVKDGTLPYIGPGEDPEPEPPATPPAGGRGKSSLKIVK